MQTKIQKWGNSLGLRIPRSFAAEAQVEEGATVDLSVEDGRLLIRPLRVRKYSLNGLLRKVSRRNLRKARRIGNLPPDVLQETVGKILALVDPSAAR
jgi:antitoxin MazE